jgi:Na+-transporting methylmalonyl-CoA/oxaloacetate decarboxylase gamma subunit
LTWGVLWLLVWLIGGICIWPQVTSSKEAKKTHLVEALKPVSAGDAQKAESELTAAMEAEEKFNTRSSSHSHALGLVLVALVFGMAQPFLGLPDGVKSIFAWLLVLGTLLMPLGVLFNISVLLIIGAALTIISVLVTLIGIINYVSPKSEPA